MKKIILVFLSLFLLVGCGTKTGRKDKLEVFSTKSENIEILESMVQKYNEENEGVEIVFTAPADAGTVLKTRLTKNDLPDLVVMGGDATFVELVESDVFVDLSDETFVSKVNDSYLDILDSIHSKDGVFGIPYASNASGVIYNVELFEEVGVEVPKTWSEFEEVVRIFKEKNISPFELTFKDAWTMLPIWNSLVPSLQPKDFPLDRRKNKTTFAETEEFREVLEKMSFIMDMAENDFMGTTYSDGNINFGKGSAAMMINGNWAIPEIKQTSKDIKVNIFPLPSTENIDQNMIVSGVDVLFAITKDSPHLEEAKKFIAYMLEEEQAEEYIKDQFAFSAIKGIVQEAENLNGAQEAIDQNRVANFPDHYYPSGFDLAAILSEFGLNKVEGTKIDDNIMKILKKIDEAYNVANVE